MSTVSEPSPAPGPRIFRVGTLTYTHRKLFQVVFWMLWGDFVFQLFESMMTVTGLLLRWQGASDTLLGWMGTLSPTIAFFWNPIVATQSDRYRGRLGRRRPFLLWATPPAVFCLIMLGAVKPGGIWAHGLLNSLGLESVTVAGCSIVWIGVGIVSFLLFNAYIIQCFACLIVDVVPGEVMGKFMGLYRSVGALGSMAFNQWALGYIEHYTLHVFVVIGLVFAVGFTLIVWNVKEGEYPPPPPKVPGGRMGAIRDYFKSSFRHRFYLNFFVITIFYWASLVPLGYVIFFGTQAGKPGYAPTLGLSLQDFGEVKGWTYILQIPAFFIVGFFADYFHPLRVALVGMVLTVLSYFCCFWFVDGKLTLLIWWSVNQVAISIYLGASSALGPRVLPRERYGQFVSANYIFGMVGQVLAPPVVGMLMQRIADYRYSFFLSGVSNTLALVALYVFYRQWKTLGGEKSFTPPDPNG
jgi:maltose/moltooligosaccharide transporter